MDDLISRDEAIRALMNSELGSWNNDDYERGTRAQHLYDVAAIKSVPSVRRKRKPSVQHDLPDTNVGDMISRQAAIDAIANKSTMSPHDRVIAVDTLVALPSAQPERLTDDDFETIRIHLNAYKEKLCNQQRWKEAEEYQRIIDRFMAFASAQPEPRWIPCSEKLPDDEADILVTYVDGEETKIVPVNYGRGTWYDCIFDRALNPFKIIAWMPLPKPYERSEDAKES